MQRQTLHATVHLKATQEVVQFYTSNPNTHTEQREALILNVVGLQMTEQLLYLTEARRTGRELSDLNVLLVVGVVLLLRIHVVVPIRASWDTQRQG